MFVMELWRNSEHQIYLPHPTKHKGETLGEAYFFENKFWKLLVMFGEDWMSMNHTKSGFSLFSYNCDSKVKSICERLNQLGIKHSVIVSRAGWNVNINISSRKANLDIIDKEYAKFYKKIKNSHNEFSRYNNYIVSKEWQNEWLKEYPETQFTNI